MGCGAAHRGPRHWGKRWPGRHRPPPAAAEGRSPSSSLPRRVVLCCQPWLFVPSPPHLLYNRLTVSGTHSSGHPALPPPCEKHETKETPLPSAFDGRWGGDLSHAVRGFQWYFSTGLECLSGSNPGDGFLLPADRSLVATLWLLLKHQTTCGWGWGRAEWALPGGSFRPSQRSQGLIVVLSVRGVCPSGNM